MAAPGPPHGFRGMTPCVRRPKTGGNNGSDPQIREEIRMAAASSWARISWPCATKFERPKSNFVGSHEITSFDDHNTEAPHSPVDTGAPDGPISRPCHEIPQ